MELLPFLTALVKIYSTLLVFLLQMLEILSASMPGQYAEILPNKCLPRWMVEGVDA
jgi:hypothetical protein